MQKIYLAKPGGQKEGPYTLEQINRDLAARKYSDADFWAWHEGLPGWMPLHSVPGVLAKAQPPPAPVAKPEPIKPEPVKPAPINPPPITSEVRPVPSAAKPMAEATPPKTKPESVAPTPGPALATPRAKAATESVARAAVESPKVQSARPPVAESRLEMPKSTAAPGPGLRTADVATVPGAKPEPGPAAALAAPSMSSGKPFSALEQIFVFTTGEGPTAFKSEITSAMLVEAAGENLENIRARVPVDVIGGADTDVLEAIRAGSLPTSAWRALFKIKPAVAQQAQDGLYHLCVRTFPVESKALVALFLLYNKQKL